MTASTFITRLAEEFPLAPVPAAGELVHDAPDDLERDSIRSAFAGKAWSDVPDEVLRYHAEALVFFKPQAWAYYIPSFLSFLVRDINAADYVYDTVLGTFASDAGQYAPLLSGAQRAVIADIVEWMLKQSSAELWPDDIERTIEHFRADT